MKKESNSVKMGGMAAGLQNVRMCGRSLDKKGRQEVIELEK